jgi:hypothetical protein
VLGLAGIPVQALVELLEQQLHFLTSSVKCVGHVQHVHAISLQQLTTKPLLSGIL